MSQNTILKNCKFFKKDLNIEKLEFCVRRNLNDYPFGVFMTLDQRVELMMKIYNVTKTFKHKLKGRFIRLKNMRQRDQNNLEHLLFE